jgi:2OG-Fe(II) oxygenase superfamily
MTPSGAIDFKKLLRQERQKAREEQLRLQKQQKQQQEEVAKDESSVANDNEMKEKKEGASSRSGTTTLGFLPHTPAALAPAWKYIHLQLQQRQQQQEQFHYCLDTKRHAVCASNPSAIYYIPNFLPTDYQNALSEWLLQLPENNHSHTTSKIEDKNLSLQQQEERAMGCWTTMKYGQRRVALFDNRRPALPPYNNSPLTDEEGENDAGENCRNNSNKLSRRGFPEPLSSLAQHISNFLAEIMPLSIQRPPTMERDEQDEKQEQQQHQQHPAAAASVVGQKEGEINHILINDYFTSQQGILPHTDGPAYQPLTATLSLQSCAILHFTPRPNTTTTTFFSTDCAQPGNDEKETNKRKRNVSVMLEPGSLVVFHQQAYSEYLHSIRGVGITTADNDDINDTAAVEVVDDTCVNAPAGTLVKRGPQRLSLTFRIKK